MAIKKNIQLREERPMSTALQKNVPAEITTPQPEPKGVTVTPRVDIVETEQELLLFADMPGVKQENVDIRFENGELTLHGRRQPIAVVKSAFVWENEAGDYFRAFRISEQVDSEKIWAEVKKGVLTLHLPKVEAV